jgi:hypothetical protein
MANTFILHNRSGSDSTSVSVAKLEESVIDRKSQLEQVVFQLKKIALQLSLVTDEEPLEGDVNKE